MESSVFFLTGSGARREIIFGVGEKLLNEDRNLYGGLKRDEINFMAVRYNIRQCKIICKAYF